MAMTIMPVRIPAELAGTLNGRLPSGVLVDTPAMVHGGPTVTLCSTATRAWRALCAAAAAAGHVLLATDSYRSYAEQERIFLARYTRTPQRGQECRVWRGQCWYKKPGVATAAVPGTSNHGRAIAVDGGEQRDGDPLPESFDPATLAWLADGNAVRYGWSWELLPEEPWHLRYWPGDRIPQAVLDYEAGLHPTPPTPEPAPPPEDDMPAPPTVLYDPVRKASWVFSIGTAGQCLARLNDDPSVDLGGEFDGAISAVQLPGAAGAFRLAGYAPKPDGRAFVATYQPGQSVRWSAT